MWLLVCVGNAAAADGKVDAEREIDATLVLVERDLHFGPGKHVHGEDGLDGGVDGAGGQANEAGLGG